MRLSCMAAALAPGALYTWGPLRVDTVRHMVWYSETSVALTRSEFRLLVALAEARGGVVPNRKLVSVLHGIGEFHDESGIKNHISRLRKRLQAAGMERDCIRNVRGEGYSLDVERLERA